MANFTNKPNLEIKLDCKTISEDGSPFYRFTMLDGEIVFWFSFHHNKNISTTRLLTYPNISL